MSASVLQPTIDELVEDVLELQKEVSGGVLASSKWGTWYSIITQTLAVPGVQSTPISYHTALPDTDVSTISFLSPNQFSINVPGIYQINVGVNNQGGAGVWTDTQKDLIIFDNAVNEPIAINSLFVPSGTISYNINYSTTIYRPSTGIISVLFKEDLVSGQTDIYGANSTTDLQTYFSWTLVAPLS
jgi:hypothetical protein